MHDNNLSHLASDYEANSKRIADIISAIARFMSNVSEQRDRANREIERKKLVQRQILQDTLGRIPVEDRLKMGIFRG